MLHFDVYVRVLVTRNTHTNKQKKRITFIENSID